MGGARIILVDFNRLIPDETDPRKVYLFHKESFVFNERNDAINKLALHAVIQRVASRLFEDFYPQI